MSKMAELAYNQDKYGQQDYVEYLEDKIELLLEDKTNKLGERIGKNTKVLERNRNRKSINMGSSKRKQWETL